MCTDVGAYIYKGHAWPKMTRQEAEDFVGCLTEIADHPAHAVGCTGANLELSQPEIDRPAAQPEILPLRHARGHLQRVLAELRMRNEPSELLWAGF